jgi:hypothetical protein
MLYYPKSQIKSNLYTNGEEYMISLTKESYEGYYYEISSGQKFTGKDPQDGTNFQLTLQTQLIPLQNITNQNSIYIETQYESNADPYKQSPITRLVPPFNQTLPTPQELKIGQYTRYFCKKNNELIYLEIDKNTYTQLQYKEPKIAWDLYTPTSIVWNTRQTELTTTTTNYSSVLKIEKDLKWYGFSQYFKNNFD